MGSIDLEQLSYWYDTYGAQLVLYARGQLDWANAEDVVQEVFVQLMGQRRRPDNVRAWLFRAVRNAAVSQLRRRARWKKLNDRLTAERTSWFESHPDDLIDARMAQTILESLPLEQREVVLLRIWGQMTLKEVAKITDRPISTVHSRYKSALEAIKKKMGLSSCKTKKT